MRDAVIVGAVRTAVGRRNGRLSPVRPDDLAAHVPRVPMGSNAMGPGEGPLSPRLQERYNIVPQGISAELIAETWGLKREELDEFSAGSHEKAGRAIAEGRFVPEITPDAPRRR